MNLINSHPSCDGLEFNDQFDGEGKLVAITAVIHRKDRKHPTMVTEYMAECKRPTEPWQKWPARMLRHKAAIQCARYAFGFAGIIDPEEAERSPEVITNNVAPPPPPAAQIAAPEPTQLSEEDATDIEPEAPFDAAAFLADLLVSLSTAETEEQLYELWDENDVEATLTDHEQALQDAFDMRKARLEVIEASGGDFPGDK